ncbi:hypothetical protein J6590_064524 [Homalodisca vitripennis]|nr:hypothetical protein J6590_064524 [Homalodisca vitripennis]
MKLAVLLGLLVIVAVAQAQYSSSSQSSSQVSSSNSQDDSCDDNGSVSGYRKQTKIEQLADGTCVQKTIETINGETSVTSEPVSCDQVKVQKKRNRKANAQMFENIKNGNF